MNSLLVLAEVVSSVESFLATVAGSYWTCEVLGAMHFALMTFKTAFVAKVFAIAGFVIADVWPIAFFQLRSRRTIKCAVRSFVFVCKPLLNVLGRLVHD